MQRNKRFLRLGCIWRDDGVPIATMRYMFHECVRFLCWIYGVRITLVPFMVISEAVDSTAFVWLLLSVRLSNFLISLNFLLW